MENWNFERSDNSNSVWMVENLKRCPLCGAVNGATNDECFVCRWHGSFEHEIASIEQGLSELVAHSPELEQAVEQNEWIPMSQSERLRAFLRKIFWPTD